MPRLEKNESKISVLKNPDDGYDWFGSNFVNPLLNTMCIEPANAVTSTFERAAGKSQYHRIEPLPVPLVADEQPTAEMICQSAAGAIGSVVPYALAGRLTANAMRFGGAAMKVDGALATLAQNEKAAQILGGGLYDGMKETHAGETHLRNGLAGAANFAVLEYWKVNTKGSLFGRSMDRFVSGATGSLAHIGISRPDIFSTDPQSKLNMPQLLLAGGLMNVLLPGTQEGLRLLQDKATMKMGLGLPIDRYMQSDRSIAFATFTNSFEKNLFEQNRWARIEPKSQYDSYLPGRDMVTLRDGSSKQTLFHELQHRKESLRGIAEPGFLRAADALKNRNVDQAWGVYSAIRLAQEVRAELAGRHNDGLANKAELIEQLKREIPWSDAIGGVPYITLWRVEFKEFMRSGGKFRPQADYSQFRFSREIREEANKLHFRLSGAQRHAGKVIDSVIDRPDLKDEQVSQVFKHVNEFLNPRGDNAVQLPLDQLAMQTLRLTANPQKVSQGAHPTCGPAALEYCTYVKSPENAANLISQVARTGKYTCADGSTIIMNGLNIIPELYWERSFANQLFQTTAVNVHWQRKSSLEPWLHTGDGIDNSIMPGAARYQRHTTNPESRIPYRLFDFSKKPVTPIHDRLRKELQDDLSDPLMDNDSLNDIHSQINGGAYGDIALPWKLPSLSVFLRILRQRQSQDALPLIMTVDARHPLFRYGLETIPESGWHFVAVRSYDKQSNQVAVFNPWGDLLRDVSAKDLHNANKEFKISTQKSL